MAKTIACRAGMELYAAGRREQGASTANSHDKGKGVGTGTGNSHSKGKSNGAGGGWSEGLGWFRG